MPVEITAGHYAPRHRVLRLSQEVYRQPSVAALGIAAHEAGHAIQHARAFAPLQVRSALAPLAGGSSNLGFVLIISGLALQTLELTWAEVGFFAFATLLALVTLPVEFDASRRAQEALTRMGLVTRSEGQGIGQVLNAAAWTYVAGFAISALQLLYWISVVGSGRRSTA
ncbi:MAG: zinc metallopeptidase [Chloroflexota bacterium]|nr:zinc metallopeptidase [Chloroflexota bacterium]